MDLWKGAKKKIERIVVMHIDGEALNDNIQQSYELHLEICSMDKCRF